MRCLILFKDSFFLSNLLTPAKLKASQTKLLFIDKSRGESQAKLGLKFTSKSQGFKSESTTDC